jgi:hypothetical protein
MRASARCCVSRPASESRPARRLLIPDILLFDREVSYDLIAGSEFGEDAQPYFISTRLILAPEAVTKRLRTFEDLWARSSALPEAETG